MYLILKTPFISKIVFLLLFFFLMGQEALCNCLTTRNYLEMRICPIFWDYSALCLVDFEGLAGDARPHHTCLLHPLSLKRNQESRQWISAVIQDTRHYGDRVFSRNSQCKEWKMMSNYWTVRVTVTSALSWENCRLFTGECSVKYSVTKIRTSKIMATASETKSQEIINKVKSLSF